MKTRLILLATILIGAMSLNAAANTKLQVTSYDNAPIVVFIDGIQYGPYASVQSISNLNPGVHNMKVVAMYTPNYSRHNAQMVIYAGPVHLTHGYEIYARVVPNYKLMIDQTVSMIHKQNLLPTCGTTGYNNPGGYNNTGNGSLGSQLQTGLMGLNNGPVATPVAAPVGVPVGPIVVPDYDFNQMLNSIQSKSFESTRINITRQLLSQNYFTAGQVRRLLGVFSFESSRLEIAELAYHSTVDPYNYYVVYDAFHFESSIVQLNQYINSL